MFNDFNYYKKKNEKDFYLKIGKKNLRETEREGFEPSVQITRTTD